MKGSQTVSKISYKNTNAQRIWYFDILRIVATFFVIILHVTSANLLALDYTTTEWQIHVLFNSASRWAVPVFIMLSGALFLHPNKPITASTLYRRYIPKMLKTFFAWSIFYAIVYTIRTRATTPSTFLYLIVCGYSHLWFIHLIISLYMLVPVLRKISDERNLLKYSVVIGLVVVFFIPTVIRFMSQFDSKLIQRILPIFSGVFNATAFAKASEYILYYLLGYYLSSEPFKSKHEFWICSLGIVGYILTVILTLWATNRNGIKTGQYYEPQELNVFLMSISAFLLAKNIMNRVSPNEKMKSFLSYLSKHSFTIYLVHMFVIDLFGDIGVHSMCFHPLLSIPILAVLVFLLSLLAAVLIEIVKAKCTGLFASWKTHHLNSGKQICG